MIIPGYISLKIQYRPYMVYELGDHNIASLVQSTNNEFWRSALMALKDYLTKVSLEESHNIFNIPLCSIQIYRNTPYT